MRAISGEGIWGLRRRSVGRLCKRLFELCNSYVEWTMLAALILTVDVSVPLFPSLDVLVSVLLAVLLVRRARPGTGSCP